MRVSLQPSPTLSIHLFNHLALSVLSLVTASSRLVGGTAGREAIGHAKRAFTAAGAVSLAVLAFVPLRQSWGSSYSLVLPQKETL